MKNACDDMPEKNAINRDSADKMTRHESIRFIHSSDWQLGMTRTFLSEEAAPRFSQARIDAITRLGELAKEHHAAFIVVAGDVFESNQVSRQTVRRTLDALEALPVPIFLLPGNHDPIDGSSIFLTDEFSAAKSHVVVLRDTQPVAVPGVSGVGVVGAPWRTKHPSSDLCADLFAELESKPETIRVVVAHGQVDTLSPDNSRPEIINLERAETRIADGLFHYLALGDRHSLTDVGTTGRIWYSGAPVATDFDEVDPGKALLVELDHEGHCETKPLSIGDWAFVTLQEEINSPEDFTRINDALVNQPNKARTILKIGLTGSINLATAARLDELFADQGESFASLRRRARTTELAILPDQLDQDSVTLTGYAKETWDELLAQADSDEEAQDALRLLYRLAERGEHA
jgi:DNA repair exonuclease SbcCD nuclease subunit